MPSVPGPSRVSEHDYYRAAEAFEHAEDHRGAIRTWTAAFVFCRTRGMAEAAHACLARLLSPLRHTGQWGRAVALSGHLLGTPRIEEPARTVAACELGLILVARGQPGTARLHLERALAFAEGTGMLRLHLDATWGLARVDAIEGRVDVAADRLGGLVRGCRADHARSALPALRWAASFFSRQGLAAAVAACAEVLADCIPVVATPGALAARECALGEEALVAGRAPTAARHFERALRLLAPLEVVPENAEVQVRAGVAHAAAGDREAALERLSAGYGAARALRADPLAAAAVTALTGLGSELGCLLRPAA